MEKEVHLSRLEPAFAAALLAGCEPLDASGRTGPDDIHAMTRRGQCFVATAPDAQAVYVITVENGIAWVNAAKGAGPLDWSALLLPIIEAQAKGCRAVAFQTKRRGLVRRATRQGYKVTGWILNKELHDSVI